MQFLCEKNQSYFDHVVKGNKIQIKMPGIFGDEPVFERFQSSRRERFLQLMFITRKFPRKRPVPLPNAKLGILLLATLGVIVSLIGCWYFGVSLHNFVVSKTIAEKIENKVNPFHNNKTQKHPRLVNNIEGLINDAKRILEKETKVMHKVDSDGIVLYSIALAAVVVALSAFFLSIIGTWLQNTRILQVALPVFFASLILGVTAAIKDAYIGPVELFYSSYSSTIMIFAFLLVSVTWILVWLHHRWLTYAFRYDKQVQQTPFYDNV